MAAGPAAAQSGRQIIIRWRSIPGREALRLWRREPLARDIERERRGVRDIEALDPARKVEPCHLIASRARQLPQALALRAQNERQRRPQHHVGEVALAGAVEADDRKAALLERGERAGKV